MRDIERELRALGERAHVKGSNYLGPAMRRRIRNRRLLTGSVGVLTTVALVAMSTYVLAARPWDSGLPPARGDARFSAEVPGDVVLLGESGFDGPIVSLAWGQKSQISSTLLCATGLPRDASLAELVNEDTGDVYSWGENFVVKHDKAAVCGHNIDASLLVDIANNPTQHRLVIDRSVEVEFLRTEVISGGEESTLYADFGADGSAIVRLSPAVDRACFDLSGVLDLHDSVQLTTDDRFSVTPPLDVSDGTTRGCVVAEEAGLSAIVESPSEYFILIESIGNRELFAPLSTEPMLGSFADCGPPLDFEPTYLPDGWVGELQQGEGGGGEFPGVVGHYGNDAQPGTIEKADGGFVTLIAGERPYAQGNIKRIRVLDRWATLGDIHEGYSVEFTRKGCDYFLIAFGIARDQLRRFTEGLRVSDGSRTDDPRYDPFAAMWPEDTEQEANDVCNEARAIEPWRTDALGTAEEFGRQVLGWEPSALAHYEEGGRVDVELRRSSTDDGAETNGPAVMVYMKEVFDDCWSVGSVGRLPDNEPTGVGISIRNRDVEIGFDDLGAESIYFEIGHGYYTNSSDPEPPDGRITALLTYRPDRTGHFLLLFKDENGEVFSATGGPLPAGDFAAG